MFLLIKYVRVPSLLSLDAENPSVTLQTMVKAARGIGKKLQVSLG